MPAPITAIAREVQPEVYFLCRNLELRTALHLATISEMEKAKENGEVKITLPTTTTEHSTSMSHVLLDIIHNLDKRPAETNPQEINCISL
jgi:hypothetical protein